MTTPTEITGALPAQGFAARYGHLVFIVLFVACFRLLYFGDPVVNIDEQYYLVVADKWFNGGLLPYVDIWDRKPVGIFLIYAPAVLWFKNAVIGYQVLGLIATLATCGLVYRMGLWLGGRFTATAAAVFYGAILMLWSGAGGQTPVFYNLPVAAGAFLVLRLVQRPELCGKAITASLLGASLLFGLALQIKYICVLEICILSLFGLAAVVADRRLSWTKAAMLAVGMIVCGLAPTIAAGASYAAIGHWQDFFFANFQSIFAKKTWRFSFFIYLLNLVSAVAYGVVFWIFTAFAFSGLRDAGRSRRWLVMGLAGWLIGAIAGALSLGNPILHYFLPTAAPLALLSATGLVHLAERNTSAHWPAARRLRFGFVGSLAVCSLAAIIIFLQTTQRRGADQVDAVAAYMNANLGGGCPYVFDDFPILYYLTRCNAPSVYAFPNHLAESAELHALAVDGLTELHRVLDARPPMIFVRRPFAPELDAEAIGILEQALDAHYILGKRFPAYRQEFDIYLRAGN